jgi:hypothetical protein
MNVSPEPERAATEMSREDGPLRQHAPEPWRQDGNYIRDADGSIVVRGRSAADARRIVAAINGTRGIPTEALEGWAVEDVSDPEARQGFEVVFEETDEEELSPHAVTPPKRRRAERRHKERRAAVAVSHPEALVFDRRVFERRGGERRKG